MVKSSINRKNFVCAYCTRTVRIGYVLIFQENNNKTLKQKKKNNRCYMDLATVFSSLSLRGNPRKKG